MRALRFVKGRREEERVWKEWLRLEVGYVEKIRGRWKILGIGKEEEQKMEVEGEEEGEGEEKEEIELPQEGEDAAMDGEIDGTAKEVEEKVLSGQEAILDGAIVRVVLDNCLACASSSFLPSLS